MDNLGELAGWGVSLIAQTGLTFDLSTPQGKLITNLMASLAEFEHDLLRERVRSGIAAAKARGQTFGRTPGYRPSDKHTDWGSDPAHPRRVSLSATGGEAAWDLEDYR
jgi:DNA invertase Pin-like site-specific DNA recombinase